MQKIQDFVAGSVRRARRWDMEQKKYVDAKYFNVIVYELDKTGKPVQIGETKIGKNTYPKYKIATMLRLPETTFLKVAAGEAKSCLMFWKPRQ